MLPASLVWLQLPRVPLETSALAQIRAAKRQEEAAWSPCLQPGCSAFAARHGPHAGMKREELRPRRRMKMQSHVHISQGWSCGFICVNECKRSGAPGMVLGTATAPRHGWGTAWAGDCSQHSHRVTEHLTLWLRAVPCSSLSSPGAKQPCPASPDPSPGRLLKCSPLRQLLEAAGACVYPLILLPFSLFPSAEGKRHTTGCG